MAFTKRIPGWNAQGVEPPQSLKDSGWKPGAKPAADHFNWLQTTASEAIKELQEKAAEKAYLDNKVDKVAGKGLSTNDYTQAEKDKLAGIVTGAEVNQNAFTTVKVASSNVVADSKTDTLELVAGANITITTDEASDKITFSASGGTATATTIMDAGNYYTSANVEGALQELGQAFSGVRGSLVTNVEGLLNS